MFNLQPSDIYHFLLPKIVRDAAIRQLADGRPFDRGRKIKPKSETKIPAIRAMIPQIFRVRLELMSKPQTWLQLAAVFR